MAALSRTRPCLVFPLLSSRGLRCFHFFPNLSSVQTRGDKIRRQREESGLGLTAFANRVGVSPSWLSRIERDKANPSPDVVRRIAVALKRDRQTRDAISQIARDDPKERDEHHRDG